MDKEISTIRKRKSVDLLEATIKTLAKEAIDEGLGFKGFLEQILEDAAEKIEKRKLKKEVA